MGFIQITSADNPAKPQPRTTAELLHHAMTRAVPYHSIDAYNIVPLEQETPFDWAVCGYYAIFPDSTHSPKHRRYKVEAFMFKARSIDGQLEISEAFSEFDCPEDLLDASPEVLNALDPTDDKNALRWRQLVRERHGGQQVPPQPVPKRVERRIPATFPYPHVA